MKLYHGTTHEGLAGMMADGVVNGPVYLTARRDVAEDYSGGVVLQFDVDTSTLEMDTEGRDFDGEDIGEWIRSGGSVYVSASLPFASARVLE